MDHNDGLRAGAKALTPPIMLHGVGISLKELSRIIYHRDRIACWKPGIQPCVPSVHCDMI